MAFAVWFFLFTDWSFSDKRYLITKLVNFFEIIDGNNRNFYRVESNFLRFTSMNPWLEEVGYCLAAMPRLFFVRFDAPEMFVCGLESSWGECFPTFPLIRTPDDVDDNFFSDSDFDFDSDTDSIS